MFVSKINVDISYSRSVAFMGIKLCAYRNALERHDRYNIEGTGHFELILQQLAWF